MKVFLSWSGDISHRVACILRDWLESVIHVIEPFVSSEDTNKGVRWSIDIARQLEEATFGIICLTPENVCAPWINFEAGALSTAIDQKWVSPFLFRMKRSDLQGPLLQFQSTIYEKEDVARLLRTINSRLPSNVTLSEDRLRKSFEKWWPELAQSLESVPQSEVTQSMVDSSVHSEVLGSEVLEEILDLVRHQQKVLASPQDLIPPAYLRGVIGDLDDRMVEIKRSVSQTSTLVDKLKAIMSDLNPTLIGVDRDILQDGRETVDQLFYQVENLRVQLKDWRLVGQRGRRLAALLAVTRAEASRFPSTSASDR